MMFSKKGIEAGGFSVIIAIIILLLSAGVIIFVIKSAATKADEKLQVDLCRVSNEIRFAYEKEAPGVAKLVGPAPPRICSTIDKTPKKFRVPTNRYDQNEEGAADEIRDMIKNCWYMWLEGSQNNMFEKMPFGNGCFVCYVFEVKDNIGKLDFEALKKSMNNPFFATDRSDKCAISGGFIQPCLDKSVDSYCPDEIKNMGDSKECPDGWVNTPSVKAASEERICCVKKGGISNECENKGGKCSKESEEDYEQFSGWKCQDGTCYVKGDDHYTYTNYITRSPRGGDVYFIPPAGGGYTKIDYAKDYDVGKKFAISFVSPARQFCGKVEGGPDKACIAGLVIGGTAAAILVPVGVVAAPGMVAAAPGAIVSVSGVIGTKGTLLAGGTAYGAHKIGILGKLKRGFANFALKPFTEEVPSLMIVSSLSHANQIGCLINE